MLHEPHSRHSQNVEYDFSTELESPSAASQWPAAGDATAFGDVLSASWQPPLLPQKPAATWSQPRRRASRYRLLKLHASGGIGEVYLALDEELRREVALKVMRPHRALEPEARHRFLQEAEITSRLEHPGIVPVYGLVEDGDYGPCYAMRFIVGETLHESIYRFHLGHRRHDACERRFGLHALLGRFVAVCNTIAYAHAHGILHRDVKPANILLGRYGETLVVDWGSAKSLQENTPTIQNLETRPDFVLPLADPYATLPGKLLGTPAFMSSEQAAGKWEDVGVASDIFSLGATLYAILTGHAPFEGGPMRDILERARRCAFPAPHQRKHDVPAALEAICLKAMALAPEERYGSALELAEDVEHFLAGEPVSVYREPLLARVGRMLRRIGRWWR